MHFNVSLLCYKSASFQKCILNFIGQTTYCHTELYCYMYVILHPICVKIQTCKLLNLTHSGSFFLRVTAFKKLYQIYLYPFGL